MGRKRIADEGSEIIRGLILPAAMVRRVMRHARTMQTAQQKRRKLPPPKMAALRDLISRGLDAAENEFEG